MNHTKLVTRGPGLGVGLALGLTWLLIAAAAWSLPQEAADRQAGALEDVELYLSAARYDVALERAAGIDQSTLAPAARAVLWRMTGYARVRQGDYEAALEDYLAVLDNPAVVDGQVLQQTRYTAAQLCFALERFDDTVRHLRDWQEAGGGEAGAFGPYILLGQAYFKNREYRHAIASLETGLGLATSAGAAVPEHWLLLLHHLYESQQQWSEAVAVLERLSRLYPSAEYDAMLERTRARTG